MRTKQLIVSLAAVAALIQPVSSSNLHAAATFGPAIQPSVETPAAPAADSADATNKVYEQSPDDLLIADFEDGNGI